MEIRSAHRFNILPHRVRPSSRDLLRSSPVLAWESDSILWLSQTLNAADAPVLIVDKTCDFGTTWSGAVNAGAYEGTSLLSTSTGMVATGWVRGQTSTVTISLTRKLSTQARCSPDERGRFVFRKCTFLNVLESALPRDATQRADRSARPHDSGIAAGRNGARRSFQ